MILKQPVIQVIGKRRAILKEPYDCGEFVVPTGFQFDGATMPTFTWSLLQLEPFGRIAAAALPHDLLYVNVGNVWNKRGELVQYSEEYADEMFYRRALDCDINWLQCRLLRRAVVWFGDYDYDQKSQSAEWNKYWLQVYNKGELNYV